MPGLVKIGKTTRDPKGRLEELSSATGVPTPFILVFDVCIPDCTAAERFVHALLESKGYRISSNREFFNVPVNESVKALQMAQERFGMALPESIPQNNGTPAPVLSPDAGRQVYEMAQASEYGLRDTLKDEDEALQLYKKAAKLGYAPAYTPIGTILWRRERKAEAIGAWKEGIVHGVGACYAELGCAFDRRQEERENSLKCWDRWFNNDAFTNNSDGQRGRYCWRYLKCGVQPLPHLEKVRVVRVDFRTFPTLFWGLTA